MAFNTVVDAIGFLALLALIAVKLLPLLDAKGKLPFLLLNATAEPKASEFAVSKDLFNTRSEAATAIRLDNNAASDPTTFLLPIALRRGVVSTKKVTSVFVSLIVVNIVILPSNKRLFLTIVKGVGKYIWFNIGLVKLCAKVPL